MLSQQKICLYPNLLKLRDNYMHHLLQHQETCVLSTRCICVFRIIINMNDDYSLYSINVLVL